MLRVSFPIDICFEGTDELSNSYSLIICADGRPKYLPIMLLRDEGLDEIFFVRPGWKAAASR
jgi:hypothetical protein